jgi:aspartyl aminopeptidase
MPEPSSAGISHAEAQEKAADMLSFINKAWTPWHAVEEASSRLAAAGFKHIAEKDAWNLKPGMQQLYCMFLCGASS